MLLASRQRGLHVFLKFMKSDASVSPQRAYWLKTLHEWHWISSAICLVAMLMFAVTGFTLNHAGQIEAKPQVSTLQAQMPAPLHGQLRGAAEAVRAGQTAEGQGRKAAGKPLPEAVRTWAEQQFHTSIGQAAVEWNEDEVYVALPRPGGDAWLRLALDDGSAEFERTDRGWISYLNDLHKGRNTGVAWSWFIDIFAAACLVFCVTGLFILQMHAGRRPMTWPMVGLGLLIPCVLALLLVH